MNTVLSLKLDQVRYKKLTVVLMFLIVLRSQAHQLPLVLLHPSTPKGTSLFSKMSSQKSDAEIGDIKRARMFFDSLVRSNRRHALKWIIAACLEEHAGRMVAARKIMKQGCEQ